MQRNLKKQAGIGGWGGVWWRVGHVRQMEWNTVPPEVEKGVSVAEVDASYVHVGEIKLQQLVEVWHTQLLCDKVMRETAPKHVLRLTDFRRLLQIYTRCPRLYRKTKTKPQQISDSVY